MGFHNSIFRGKSLGANVTDAQWAAISAGTFDDLYIGDYWTINSVPWRIAAFDYYLRTGDTACSTHHVVIVPDANLYAYKMNDTDTTAGGYVGSKMYTEGLEQAKTIINAAFGSDHILTHRQLLVNAVTDGTPSGTSWYDSTVELMTERNIWGASIYGAGSVGSIDNIQFPLFSLNPLIINNRNWLWLRDIASAAGFVGINGQGIPSTAGASAERQVRPQFAIKG